MSPSSTLPRLARFPRIIILVSLATIILTVFAVFQLSQVWLRAEMDRESDQALMRYADNGAAEIGEDWQREPMNALVDRHNDELAFRALRRLVRNHPRVVFVILADLEGRVRLCYGESKPGFQLPPQYELATWLRGFSEHDIVKDIRHLFPMLRSTTIEVRHGNATIGQLIFLTRSELHQNLTAEAAIRLATWISLMLLGVGLLVGSAIWIILRQQALTERLRRQRDKAERFAYVGALAAGLAHEIRNPINALNMHLDMLEEDIAEGNRTASGDRLQRVRKGLSGVEHTVRDFLTYATPQAQRPSHVNLASEVEALAAAAVEQDGPPPVEIQCLIPRDLTAWCDPHALRQIMTNMLINAIRIQRKGGERVLIRVEGVRHGGRSELIIDDAGPGIPPGDAETIFQAFYTTDTRGTGLGLAIARRLAEMNGGTLVARDAPSPLGGARFSLELPIQPSIDPLEH